MVLMIQKKKLFRKYIDDSKYGDYLINLLTIMSSNTDQIVQDWKTYKDSFIQSSEIQIQFFEYDNQMICLLL